MPGPIVDERTTDFMYLPFAAAGFAFWTAVRSASVFSTSWASGNETLPTGTWMIAVLSTRNSILPAFSSLTAFETSNVTVPGLRVRHEAARAEHLPEPSERLHHVGRRDEGLEVEEAGLDLRDEVVPAHEVGARRLGFLDLLAGGDDGHARRLPEAVRKHDRAAHHLVRVLRVDAEAEGHLDGLVELGERRRLDERDGLGDVVELRLVDLRGGRGEFLATHGVFLSGVGRVPRVRR